MSRQPLLIVVGLVACVGTAGCTSGDAGGMLGGSFACNADVGGNHSCIVYTWNGGTQTTDFWRQSCARAGGTAARGCTITDAIGGCAFIAKSGITTITTTTWYYSGDPGSVEADCGRAGGT